MPAAVLNKIADTMLGMRYSKMTKIEKDVAKILVEEDYAGWQYLGSTTGADRILVELIEAITEPTTATV